MDENIPCFGGLTTKAVLTGDKVRIDDLLNKQIVVCNYHVSTSKFKDKFHDNYIAGYLFLALRRN